MYCSKILQIDSISCWFWSAMATPCWTSLYHIWEMVIYSLYWHLMFLLHVDLCLAEYFQRVVLFAKTIQKCKDSNQNTWHLRISFLIVGGWVGELAKLIRVFLNFQPILYFWVFTSLQLTVCSNFPIIFNNVLWYNLYFL